MCKFIGNLFCHFEIGVKLREAVDDHLAVAWAVLHSVSVAPHIVARYEGRPAPCKGIEYALALT